MPQKPTTNVIGGATNSAGENKNSNSNSNNNGRSYSNRNRSYNC